MFRLPATCRSHILIFPGFLFCFLIGLLLAGIDRKIVAKMQKRVGPPVLQPFYDFFKLCGKETIVPAAANKGMFLGAPLLGLAALVVLQMFIPALRCWDWPRSSCCRCSSLCPPSPRFPRWLT